METYSLMKKIWSSGISELYLAKVRNGADVDSSLSYVAKKYEKDISDELIKNEIGISQSIEDTCPGSITIPILEKTKIAGDEYVILQFRKNGLFLNEMIEQLSKKYSDIPLSVILSVAEKILLSLQRLHRYSYEGKDCGFLHLDLNPGNIFFESADLASEEWGTAKFIDFGSSVPIEHKTRVLKKRKWYSYTPFYSAPEIEENMVSHILPSSDLYSVCACMLRMYVGKSCLSKADNDRFKWVKDNSLLSYMFVNIIENGMQEHAGYRYKDAGEMLDDIRALMDCINYEETGDYYKLFEACYRSSVPKDVVIKTNLSLKKREFFDSAFVLENSIKQMNVNYHKNMYIFECMYALSKRAINDNDEKMIEFLTSGISCCNYMGDTIRALQLSEEIIKFDQALPINTIITARLRYAVSLADCYQFEKALLVVDELINSLESLKKLMFKKNGIHIKELGRCYSAKATYLSFLKREGALEVYEKSINEFKGDTDNKHITYVKILHTAIEQEDKNAFEKYFSKIIPGGNPIEYLNLHLQEADKYDIFVSLKAINAFYMKDITDDFIEKVVGYLDSMMGKDKGHPFPLIYKYAALIAYKLGLLEKSRIYFKNSIEMSLNGQIRLDKEMNLLMLMSYQTLWIWNSLENRDKENEILLNEAIRHCRFSSWNELENILQQTKSLEYVLCHEYN